VVVVADHTKIGRPALAFLCDFAAVDTFITDNGLSSDQRRLLEQSEVRLIVAGETTEEQQL
jgi:DeoR/GlpR family transcriptional regulator of sugar metabolism